MNYIHLLIILVLLHYGPTSPQKYIPLESTEPVYKLIAHRGGIVEGRYPENTESAINAAVERGYWMLEVDIRESKDGKLIVHHDRDFRRFYNDERLVANMTWDEISQLRSVQGNERPLQFYELAALCKGKIRIMMDTKGPSHNQAFYEEMEKVLRENQLLETAYFIGTQESKDYFKGKARISANRESLSEAIEHGENVSELYFLFEHGNELDVQTVKMAQSHQVPVVPSVNLFHYDNESHISGAYRDITWLKEEGVTEYQIDSEYDRWLLFQGPITHGPVLGHTTPNSIHIWARFDSPGKHTLILLHPNGETSKFDTEASLANDLTATWKITDLIPNTNYKYTIDKIEKVHSFRTPKPYSTPQITTLVLGSCIHDEWGQSYPIWKEMYNQNPDVLLLLGDTPYIDATNPHYQQRRYREFYTMKEFESFIQKIPFYSIWDDHDFGKNDTDGNLSGKEHSREAFMMYRPNPSYGENGKGIYTSFRMGDLEVFLLDTRWFAGTEPSFADPKLPTLIGEQQWEWLKKGLNESDASFKILACGMIWNGATRPNKPDHWDNYEYEKKALFKFINKNKISGIILVGGDIHRSRYLLHSTQELAGYDIPEFITSPMHEGVIASANTPHPDLVYDRGVPESYLIAEFDSQADTPTAKFICMTIDGTVQFTVTLTQSDLSH